MKKQIISWGMMLAAAFTLTNCAKEIEGPAQEPETNGYPFEIVASTVDTKTVNDGMATKWVDGDKINLFHAEAGGTEYQNDADFTVADVDAGRFTGELSSALEAGKKYDWYAIYPYSSQIETPGERTKGYTYLGHSKGLNQTGYNSTDALDGSNCPFYGVAKSVDANLIPSIDMKHLTSVVAINVTNTTDTPVTITTASLTATEDIVGSYYIDITGSSVAYNPSEGYVKNTATVNVSGGTALAKGESAILYLAIKPFTAAAGSKLVLSVNDNCEKELVMSKDVTFTAGKIKTLNFKYDAKVEPESANVTWNLSVNETSEATVDRIAWTSDFAEMYSEKVGSSTNANNYYGGDANSRTSTRFYTNNTLTISPKTGYAITSVVFSATSDGYANALSNSSWTNASAEVSGQKITVTPADGTKAMVAKVGGTCGFTSVVVYYVEAEGGSDEPEQPGEPTEVATWSWAGGVKVDFEKFNGVEEVHGLGSDYAESNAPYRIKLDGTGDYFIIKVDGAIQSVSVGVKMLGGANTSDLDIQGSTDGESFTTVQKLTISGSQNDIINLTTTNTFDASYRYVKFHFTKGSNVGVGPITITYIPDDNGSGSETPDEVPEIVVTDKEQSIGAEGGDLEFEYTVTNTDSEPEATVTQGADFLEPVSVENGIIAVTVKENETASERVAKITLTCGDATPVVLTITQERKVVVDDSFEPGLYWIMATEDGTTKVMTPLGETANYGYGQSTTVTDGRSYARNAFTFTAVEGGFTIQDVLGRYYYTTDEHKSFQLSSDSSADGLVWTVGVGDNGTVILTNVRTSRTLKYGDGTYTTFGVYKDSEEETGVYPTLVKADNPLPVELSSISVNGHKTSFVEGDAFEFGGTVTANYSDGTTKNVTANASVTTPEMVNGASVTVSYTEGGITKTFSYNITVKAAGESGGNEIIDLTGTWTLGSNAYDNTKTGNSKQEATINGVKYNNLLKLGTSSNSGSATFKIPAGTTRITYSAVAWKGTKATLKFTIAGTSYEQTVQANVGATGNPSYTITASDSDNYALELSVSAETSVTITTTTAARALIWDLKAIVAN